MRPLKTVGILLGLALLLAVPAMAATVDEVVESAVKNYMQMEKDASLAGVATYTKEQIAQAIKEPEKELSPSMEASFNEAYKQAMEEEGLVPVSISAKLASEIMNLSRDDASLQAARIANTALKVTGILGMDPQTTARVICGTMQGIREGAEANEFDWEEIQLTLDNVFKAWAADPAMGSLDRVAAQCLVDREVDAATYTPLALVPDTLGPPEGPDFDRVLSDSGGGGI